MTNISIYLYLFILLRIDFLSLFYVNLKKKITKYKSVNADHINRHAYSSIIKITSYVLKCHPQCHFHIWGHYIISRFNGLKYFHG